MTQPTIANTTATATVPPSPLSGSTGCETPVSGGNSISFGAE